MAWTRFTFTDYINCADKLAAFLTRAKQPSSVTAGGSNTGNGIIFGLSSTAASVDETFTLTCVTGGASAVFSIDGDATLPMDNVSVNVPYVHDKICFTLLAGTVNFALGDTLTFTTGTATANWTQMRNENRRDAATGKEYVFKGRGGGSDEIYVGIRTVTNSSTYYNWGLQCFTGYIEATAFQNLPGYRADPYTSFPSTGSNIAWVFESARRIIVIPVSSSDYHGQAYLGWILPTATPSQWGNPLFVGGDSNTSTTTYTGTRAAWWKTKANNRMYDGSVWDVNSDTWPYKDYLPVKDVNGAFPLLPVTVLNAGSTGRKIYGEAEGCFAIAGDGGAVGTGDTVICNNEFYIITKNVSVVGDADIMAVKLT